MLKVKREGIFLSPTEHRFENQGVFNPACAEHEGRIHMFYRATSVGNYSTIGHCLLENPVKILKRNDKPVLLPQHKYEAQGMEDPRIVRIGKEFHLTYTAYDGKNALGALAISEDLSVFTKKGIITPQMTYRDFELCIQCCDGNTEKYLRFVKLFYKRGGAETSSNLLIWDKDVMFFPGKINGKFAFLHRIYPDIQVVYYNNLEELTDGFWKEYLFNIRKYTVLESKMPFEASYIGGGCPPLLTERGWLVVYHGVEDTSSGYKYHAGVALLDTDDPTKEIGRLKTPLFSPELEWEKHGVVSNVVFPTGALSRDGILYIYYGAADKQIGVVSVEIESLLNELIK